MGYIVNFYNTKQAYTVMKLDCMLQNMEAIGFCDLEQLHEFVVLFKTLNEKHQQRYATLLDTACDFWDDGEQPCS